MITQRQKSQAQRAVFMAVRDGLLARQSTCESCGIEHDASKIVLHHHDYDKPLDVIPLCRTCHMLVHRGSKPEPRTGRIYPRPSKRPAPCEGIMVRMCLGRLLNGQNAPASVPKADRALILHVLSEFGGLDAARRRADRTQMVHRMTARFVELRAGLAQAGAEVEPPAASSEAA